MSACVGHAFRKDQRDPFVRAGRVPASSRVTRSRGCGQRWPRWIVRLLVGLVAATVTGCAPTVPGVWTKAAVDPQEQRRDEYDCARHATFTAETRSERTAAFAACMRARGYAPAQGR